MSQEERKPTVTTTALSVVPSSGVSAKDTAPKHVTPAAAPAAPSTTENYKECKVCGAGVSDKCKGVIPDAGKGERYKCDIFREQMGWGQYNTTWDTPSTATAYSKPSPEKVILAQPVGDTGFPRIPQDQLMQRADIKLLLEMLGHMRPGGTKTENAYIEKYIVPLGSKKDKYGNRWVWVPNADGSQSEILFSSHTDTVHRVGGHQQIVVGDGRVWTESGSCLGADDTVGNWMMIEMIKARVPGCYIFHREEECGGNGSAWIKKNKSQSLSKMKAAIAFDRKAYHSIITHQGGERCCSEAFSASLSAVLGGSFKSDTGGTFTDTKNYTGLIGECTNLSVGYHAQHGPTEWQELSFAVGLKDKLIAADWSKLEFERKPGEYESLYRGSGGGRYGSPYGYTQWWDSDEAWAGEATAATKSAAVTAAKPATPTRRPPSPAATAHAKRINKMAEEYANHKFQQIANDFEDTMSFVIMSPETVTNFLMEKGFTALDIEEWYDAEGRDLPGAEDWDADPDVLV